MSPAGIFRAKGGSLVIMAFLHHWKDLCAAMGKPELVEHERYGNDVTRLQHRDEVVAIIETWLQETFPDVDSAVAHMEEFGVPVAPVLSVAETTRHPHLRARGTVRTISDPLAGEFDIPGMPLRFSGFPDDLPLRAPTLGQHNEEILTQYLNRSPEEVERLRADGVLYEKNS